MTALEEEAAESGRAPGALARLFRMLGPGFITGASDDDPSGIGTYSQAGAQLGFGIGWTMLFTFPLMAAIQEISARIGRTTGQGIAGNLSRHYPAWSLYLIVTLLFLANAINIGADLNAMADALKMLVGGYAALYVHLFGVICVLAIVFLDYTTYARILKWSTLTLFAYVATLFAIRIPWGEALAGILIPRMAFTTDYLTTLVAILRTTISPYLFFWQASNEVEEVRANDAAKPLKRAPRQAPGEFERIRADTLIGMAFSNLIAIVIILATAAALHQNGITDIESSTQAAEALRPIAGDLAFGLFALGIIGMGLLAIPVLAGSAAYAVGEACKWPVGLSKKPDKAAAFYGTLTAAAALGVLLTFMPIDPPVRLKRSQVVPMSLILHELVSNTLKYGALSQSGGVVHLTWSVAPEADRSVLQLTWHEENGPPVTPPSRSGFGSRLIKYSAEQGLGGRAELKFEPTGLRVHVTAPIQ